MDLTDSPGHAAFRARVRAWLDANAADAPAVEHSPMLRSLPEDVEPRRRWQARLADAGFVGLAWPEWAGGGGLTELEHVLLVQELARRGLPGIFDVLGTGVIAPAIIAHGTREQVERFLPRLRRADEVWCQLFSEPDTGSDLAAVRTRAREQPDGSWRIDGQKTWTTNAHVATFGLLLARTDPGARTHRALTAFALPMDAPGVVVRPIRKSSGCADEFNEVFLDDVALSADHRIGARGDGWAVAMSMMTSERGMTGFNLSALGGDPERLRAALAPHLDATGDTAALLALGAVVADLIALRFEGLRVLDALQHGAEPGAETALGKVTTIHVLERLADVVLDVLGPAALVDFWGFLHTTVPGFRAAGGAEEILRNVTGERVLGLEREPRRDVAPAGARA